MGYEDLYGRNKCFYMQILAYGRNFVYKKLIFLVTSRKSSFLVIFFILQVITCEEWTIFEVASLKKNVAFSVVHCLPIKKSLGHNPEESLEQIVMMLLLLLPTRLWLVDRDQPCWVSSSVLSTYLYPPDFCGPLKLFKPWSTVPCCPPKRRPKAIFIPH